MSIMIGVPSPVASLPHLGHSLLDKFFTVSIYYLGDIKADARQ